MPYHIKKPSLINASVDVYYTGNRLSLIHISEPTRPY